MDRISKRFLCDFTFRKGTQVTRFEPQRGDTFGQRRAGDARSASIATDRAALNGFFRGRAGRQNVKR